MRNFLSIGSKALATILGGAVLVVGLYAPVTAPRANAQLATFDWANFVTNTAQTTILQTLNGVAWAVAKTAIQSMTRSIVTWINSGYQGEPAFSQNMTRDLRQVGDGVSNLFLYNLRKNIREGTVNSPFAEQIAQMTVDGYLLVTGDGDLLTQRLRYTLLDYTQDSVAYMRGDWSKGGLRGWHALTMGCGNDPYCVSFATQAELAGKIGAETDKWLADFTNGRGFLSWKGECNTYQQATNRNSAASNSGPCSSANYNESACLAYLNSGQTVVDSGVALSDADTCVSYDVLTPGAVVEDQLVGVVGSPIRQLELADSINEIVGAVVTQMVGSVLGGGGLSGQSKPRANGSGTPVNQATTPTVDAGISAGFESMVQSERSKTVDFRQSWTDIKTIAEQARLACGTGGGGVVAAFRTAEIAETIEKADESIERANRALTAIDEVLVLLEEANEPSLFATTKATASQNAFTAYQRLLSGNELISGQEQAGAIVARSESEDSEYEKMAEYVNQCD